MVEIPPDHLRRLESGYGPFIEQPTFSENFMKDWG